MRPTRSSESNSDSAIAMTMTAMTASIARRAKRRRVAASRERPLSPVTISASLRRAADEEAVHEEDDQRAGQQRAQRREEVAVLLEPRLIGGCGCDDVSHVGVTVQKRQASRRVAAGPWRADFAAALRAFWLSRAIVWAGGPGRGRRLGRPRGAPRRVRPDRRDAAVRRVRRPARRRPPARWDSVWFLTIADYGLRRRRPRRVLPALPAARRARRRRCAARRWSRRSRCRARRSSSALAALHRLAVIEVGPEAARWAVLALALFPGVAVVLGGLLASRCS